MMGSLVHVVIVLAVLALPVLAIVVAVKLLGKRK